MADETADETGLKILMLATEAVPFAKEGGVADVLGSADPRFAAIDDQLTLRTLVQALPARERRILTLRFYDEMTQAQIGTEIGVSQMHVSRLLKQTLALLQAGMTAPGA